MLPPYAARRPARRSKRRKLALIPALAGLLLAGTAVPAVADSASGTNPTSSAMAAAQTQALSTGQAVPVTSLTTQTQTVTANTDGTFTSTNSNQPVRVQQNGAWTPVNATLAANPGGTYSPTATPDAIALSGGGSGPVVTMTDPSGNTLALTLPFTLPAPAVSGDTALYSSVLPGVDLSLTVTNQGGFSDVLIVHSAAAAANPLITQLTLAASTNGLTLSGTPSGGFSATASDGTTSYTSPAPLMWDSNTTASSSIASATASTAASSTAAGSSVTTRHQALRADNAVASTTSSASATDAPSTSATSTPVSETSASSVDGPGSDAQVAPLTMTTTSTAITLTPDNTLLTSPDTMYPVYLDPGVATNGSGSFDQVYSSSTCSGTPQYKIAQTWGLGVGYQSQGGTCGDGFERALYNVSTTNLNSTMNVSSALVTVQATYAADWDCSQKEPVTLHTGIGQVDSGTDWHNQPSLDDKNFAAVPTTVTSAHNPNSTCSDNDASFTVTTQARTIAGSNAPYWTMVMVGDENTSDGNNYLRLSTTLVLTTTYDIAPTIGALTMNPLPQTSATSAGVCSPSSSGWIGASAVTGSSSDIHLNATVTAKAPGENVGAWFNVFDDTTNDGAGNPKLMNVPTSGLVASGTSVNTALGFVVQDGHTYQWDTWARDTTGLVSPTATGCHFSIDATPPNTPTLTPDTATSASFPPVGSGAPKPVVYAGTEVNGQLVTLNFAVTATDPLPASTCTRGSCTASGIDHFVYRLDSEPTTSVGLSLPTTSTGTDGSNDPTASATLNLPIPNWGVHTLYVMAVDKAGNPSQAPASYTFAVPWNPNSKVTPGDVTGDGVPDLVSTTSTGDLEVIPGNTDTAQSATAQTQPQAAAAYTAPVLVSVPTDSPTKDTWKNYLVAHRGSLTGQSVDDLFAMDTATVPNQLYAVENDANITAGTYGFFDQDNKSITKPTACETIDTSRCDPSTYQTTWDSSDQVAQIAAPGYVYNTAAHDPDLITIEKNTATSTHQLWLYQGMGGTTLANPILLGTGDWSGSTLIAPGTIAGTPTLWARLDSTGQLYSYSLAINATTGLPPLLVPPGVAPVSGDESGTTFGPSLPKSNYPFIASPGDINGTISQTNPTGTPDGIPDLYVTDTNGQLIEYPGATDNPASTMAAHGPAALPTHWWTLTDGNTTTTANDDAYAPSTSLPLTLSNSGAQWSTDAALATADTAPGTSNQSGTALTFNGNGYAATNGPAVNTSNSYTVSAWVKLTTLGTTDQWAVAQNTANHQAFLLGYSGTAKTWAFDTSTSDTAGPTTYAAATSGTPATAGTWTHLVGTYDASTGTIDLYVNDALAGTGSNTTPTYNSSGIVTIGSTATAGTTPSLYGQIVGSVSDVRVYNSAANATSTLSSAVPLSPLSSTATNWWELDDNTSPAVDSISGNKATLTTTGAIWATDPTLTTANPGLLAANPTSTVLSLDGTTGYAATTSPAVNTTGDYTVSAWAKLNSSFNSNDYYTVVAQRDTAGVRSGFYLQYSAAYKSWALVIPNTDSANAPVYYHANGSTTVANQWYHLVATYQAATGSMSLYVNGNLVGTGTDTGTPWAATGPLLIGGADGGTTPGSAADFPGQIADLHIYDTALPAADAAALGDSTPITGLN